MGNGHCVVDGHVAQRAHGHARKLGILGALHHGRAAAALNEIEARRTIVQQAREHQADSMRIELHGGRAKQGVGGRAVAIFVRALGHEQVVVFHQQVAVGRGQVEVAGLQGRAVGSQLAVQGRVVGQPGHQRLARRVGAQVLHHQHGGRQRSGQLRYQARERRHAAGRSTNNNEVSRASHKRKQKSKNSQARTAPRGLAWQAVRARSASG